MKVKDLKDRKPVDEITLKITAKEDTRELRNGQLKVCNCMGKDDTGEVIVTLWNDDIDRVKVEDTIKITKG
jgi:ssDNA-binding replication factor A large subunit